MVTEDAVDAGHGPMASLCVLGSIGAIANGQPVALGGEKPRRLLAMLILHRNAVISADRLAQAMWGDDVPDTGAATLQSYVSRLRRLLPPPIQLISEPPGYRLAVDRATTDVDRFEDALADGHGPARASTPMSAWHISTTRSPSGGATRSPSSPTSRGPAPKRYASKSCASTPAKPG